MNTNTRLNCRFPVGGCAISTVAIALALIVMPAQGQTELLKDIKPGSNGSNPNGFTKVNEAVFFSLRTEEPNLDIWDKLYDKEKEKILKALDITEYPIYAKLVERGDV